MLIFRLCLLHIGTQATELSLLIPNHNNNKCNDCNQTQGLFKLSGETEREKSLWTVQFSTKE